MRRRLAIAAGDRVEFAIRRRPPAPDPDIPPALARALTRNPQAQAWWPHLRPAQRRTALSFMGAARSPEVMAWRISDVLRRAKRHFDKEGPFYPTREDQPLLSRTSEQVPRARKASTHPPNSRPA